MAPPPPQSATEQVSADSDDDTAGGADEVASVGDVKGQREWKEEKKQLAALAEKDGDDGGKGDMKMNEQQREALMSSLAQKEGEQLPVHVDPAAVKNLQELFLIPASMAEKVLRKEGGDVDKAAKRLLLCEDEAADCLH